MKIIRPYARLDAGVMGENPDDSFTLEMGIKLLKLIEYEARKSHRSEDKVTPDSWERFVRFVVIEKGDWSVVEHATVQIDSVTDRGITHEWVRHRLESFTQESTRFVNYEKKMPPSFIYPQVDVECPLCLSGEEPYWSASNGLTWMHGDWQKTEENHIPCLYQPSWLAAIAKAEQSYKILTKPVIDGGRGWRPQEARSVLPNALASRIGTTSNLRNWRHVLIMRTTAEAHPQYRQVAIPLLKECQEKIPILFDDIVPNMKQSEAIKKAR